VRSDPKAATARWIRALGVPLAGAVVVLVVALLVRSGAPTARPVQSGTTRSHQAVASGHVTVSIVDYAYSPQRLTVRAGTSVTWTNHDATAHTATANDSASFDTGTINPHHSRTVRFTHPGSYSYHCAFHAFMTGTITVVR
jgi:plastocyanin